MNPVTTGFLAAQRPVAEAPPGGLEAFDRHGPMMLGVAKQILGDAVEAEEALIEACVALENGQGPQGLDLADAGRFCALSRQVALRRLRRRLQRPPVATVTVSPDLAAATVRHQVITAALANLPADQQQILHFAFGQGMDVETIGTVRREPVAAVHAALGEALDRLALVVSHLWRRP